MSSTPVPMELDHVLIAVADLASAGQAIEERYGLSSVAGGRHPAWGTANRIVPLGKAYLELVAVVDESKASESTFGRWVAARASDAGQLLGWAVRTSRLDPIAQRLDLPIRDGSRAAPGGEQPRWRSAGIDQATAEPSLPFFIEWDAATKLPGSAPVHHRIGRARISGLVLEADPARLAGWLGEHELPIVVHEGRPAVVEIRISSDAGDFVIGSVAG